MAHVPLPNDHYAANKPISNRSVLFMTPEQLQRKRAYDRSNQRDTRRQNQIKLATLENENKTLRSRLNEIEQQVEQLQAREAARPQVQQDVQASIAKLDGPSLETFPGRTALIASRVEDVSSLGSLNVESSIACRQNCQLGLNLGRSEQVTSTRQVNINKASPGIPTSSSMQAPYNLMPEDQSIAYVNYVSATLYPGIPSPQPSVDDVGGVFNFLTTNSAWSDNISGPPPGFSCYLTVPSAGANEVDDLTQLPSIPRADRGCLNPWEALPAHSSPTCRFDYTLLHSIKNTMQEDKKFQVDLTESSCKPFPSVSSLLNPAADKCVDNYESSVGFHGHWMAISSIAAKIAVMYNVCYVIRWLTAPTKASYEAMPEFMRPVELQIKVPHPIWIDMVPWPQAREQLIYHQTWVRDFQTYRKIHNETLSVNWMRPLAEVLASNSRDESIINPTFEKHIRHIENWSVGPELVCALPYMHCIPVHQNLREVEA